MNLINKIKLLEQYVSIDNSTTDQIIYVTIEKILSREYAKLFDLKSRLEVEISNFEKQYEMNTLTFYPKFEDGSMGDDIDYIEWASTYEMIKNINSKISLLEKGLTSE